MGKVKKGFNRKARQVNEDKGTSAKDKNKLQNLVEIDKDCYKKVSENDSNLLVLDSKKVKPKAKYKEIQRAKKPLTKKQKKKLQYIVDQKKKKEKVRIYFVSFTGFKKIIILTL